MTLGRRSSAGVVRRRVWRKERGGSFEPCVPAGSLLSAASPITPLSSRHHTFLICSSHSYSTVATGFLPFLLEFPIEKPF